jgi:hypothetical protein
VRINSSLDKINLDEDYDDYNKADILLLSPETSV